MPTKVKSTATFKSWNHTTAIPASASLSYLRNFRYRNLPLTWNVFIHVFETSNFQQIFMQTWYVMFKHYGLKHNGLLYISTKVFLLWYLTSNSIKHSNFTIYAAYENILKHWFCRFICTYIYCFLNAHSITHNCFKARPNWICIRA